jgi:hypothetical protein
MRKVYGIGITDITGIYGNDGRVIPSYRHWSEMLRRCYSKKYQVKNKTYADCYVCDEWHYFSNFKEWFDLNYITDYHLDKDIIKKGNKCYCPEYCCFVPHEINNIFTKVDRNRGNLPIGVTQYKGDNFFVAKIRKYGKEIYLGTFSDVQSAFMEYKKHKEAYIHEIAEIYKPTISRKAYNALINYQVDIND